MNTSQLSTRDQQILDQINRPLDVPSLISVLEKWSLKDDDRREYVRLSFRVKGAIEILPKSSEVASKEDVVTIYTRDISAWGLGFFCTKAIPITRDAHIYIPDKSGIRCINCTILRCSGMINGWYEGAVYFEQEQIIPTEVSLDDRSDFQAHSVSSLRELPNRPD